MAKKKTALQYIEPIGGRVLVLKDEPKRETKGGIALPDAAEIPTITGRIVTISTVIENYDDVRKGDVIEIFEREEVERTLD